MRRSFAVVAACVALMTTGCAASVSDWIVQTRNHQGDVALSNRNYPDASLAYQLALRVDRTNKHAQAGLVNVQTRIAQTLYNASRLEEALDALALAKRYDPTDEGAAALRSEIEQAQIKRDIVVSNFPQYRETNRSLARAFVQVRAQTAKITAALQSFNHTYDAADLSSAVRDSYALDAEIAQLTNRLVTYRQLVESGVPDAPGTAPIAPPSSLLPLP